LGHHGVLPDAYVGAGEPNLYVVGSDTHEVDYIVENVDPRTYFHVDIATIVTGLKPNPRVVTGDSRPNGDKEMIKAEAQFEAAFEQIDIGLRTGRNVVLNCKKGEKRSPSVAIAYMLFKEMFDNIHEAKEHVLNIRQATLKEKGFRSISQGPLSRDLNFETVIAKFAPPQVQQKRQRK